MAAEWFCKISGKTLGPLSTQQLKAMAEAGQLSAEHEIRQGTEGSWVPAGRAKGLIPARIPVARPLDEAVAKPGARAKPAAPRAAAASRLPVAKPAPKPPRATPAPAPPRASAAPPVAPSPPRAFGSQYGASTSALGRGADHPSKGRRSRQRNKAATIVVLLLLVIGLAGLGGFVLYSGNPFARQGDTAANRTDSSPPAVELPAENVSWADASNSWIPCGDVKVQIVSARVATPRMVHSPGRTSIPKGRYLLIGIELLNGSETRICEYTSWNVRASRAPKTPLTDNLGNAYRQRFPDAFRGARPEQGQLERASIYPGKSAEDLLIFQEPVDKPQLEYLRLTLSADVLGQPGKLYFQIPKSMIERSELAAETREAEPPGERADPEQPAEMPTVSADAPSGPEEDPVAAAVGGAIGEMPNDRYKDDDPFKDMDQPGAEQPRGEEREPSIFDDEPGLRGSGEGEQEDFSFEGKIDQFDQKPEEEKRERSDRRLPP